MKIVRYFIQHVGEETGFNGWLPLWVPKSAGFDPFSDATGMLHDMLEHRLCDTGKFHEELQAFGRVIALRSIPGVGARSSYSYEESLGMEISGVWARGEGDRIEAPPPTAPIEFVDANLQALCRRCLKSLESDMKEHDRHLEPFDQVVFASSMLGWLRIGYRDALRRYGQQDHGCWDNGRQAFAWAVKNNKRMSQEAEDCIPGSVMRLCWDTESLRMQDTLLEPGGPLERHPTWLRQRIRAWQMG